MRPSSIPDRFKLTYYCEIGNGIHIYALPSFIQATPQAGMNINHAAEVSRTRYGEIFSVRASVILRWPLSSLFGSTLSLTNVTDRVELPLGPGYSRLVTAT